MRPVHFIHGHVKMDKSGTVFISPEKLIPAEFLPIAAQSLKFEKNEKNKNNILD